MPGSTVAPCREGSREATSFATGRRAAATAAGLGFASVENVLYLLQSQDPSIVVMRGFTATLAHVATSGSFGFCLAMTRFTSWPRAVTYLLLGPAFAITCHGAYNFFLYRGGDLKWVSLILLLPLMLVWLGLKIRWARGDTRRGKLPPPPTATSS